jgi:ribosomal-protein-alanine N-acetyltransferase
MTTPDRIKTERLILRRYQLTDAGEIFACYAQDEMVTKYLTWKPHQSIEETQAFIEGRMDAWNQGDDFTWAVTMIDGHLIGAISLRISGFKADFGYVIGRQFWGNGYAAEALQAIIQWAFEQPQIFRVWAVCDVENTASARVMEKCGLEREGVLKRWIMHPQISNAPRDCFCYSITREMASQQSHAANSNKSRR